MAKRIVALRALYSGCIACVVLAGCKSKTTEEPVKTAYFHRYGVEVADEKDWVDRGGNGEIVKTLKNGVTVKERYKDSMLQGETTATYPHSQVIKRCTVYDKGILVAETDNYISGTPCEKKQFFSDGRVACVAWYEDGTPRAKEDYQANLLIKGEYMNHDSHPEAHVVDGVGIRIIRDGLGNLVAKETISQGECILSESYHSNGVPKERVPFTKGKIDGVKKVFLVGGEPARFEEWKNGVLEGSVQIFENGEKIAEVPYVQGEKNGIELRFKAGTNTVVEEISWSRDKRHGPAITSIDGNQVTDWYYEGKKVSKPQYLEMMTRAFPSER